VINNDSSGGTGSIRGFSVIRHQPPLAAKLSIAPAVKLALTLLVSFSARSVWTGLCSTAGGMDRGR
jgi:hypothetical protein